MKHYRFENAAVRLAGYHATCEFLGPIFTERDRELLVVALCDSDLRLLRLLSIPGTETEVQFTLADVLRPAICAQAKGIVLAHNHPSQDRRPSASDKAITRRVTLVAEAMDVTLLDHLIFNGGDPFSFRRHGHL